MAISVTNRHAEVKTGDANSFSFGAFAVTAGRWLVLDVGNGKASGAADTPSLSGSSLTYNQEATLAVNTTKRLTRFYVWTAAVTSLTVAVDFAGVTQENCSLIANELDGVDASDPFTQTVTGNNGGSAGTTYTATLAAYTGADSRPLAAFGTWPNSSATAEAGYTALNNTTGGTEHTIGTMWHSTTQDTTPSWTGTSRFHVVIASEIKPAAVAGAVSSRLLLGVGA